MATLTEITYFIRKGLIVGTFGTIVLSVLGFGIWYAIENTKEEVPIPTPTPGVSFGPLPKLSFPHNNQYPKTFELLTIEGKPPEGTSSANVYFIPKKNTTLFSRKNAEEFAKNLGFPPNPESITDTIYTYADSETNSTLVLDISTNNFTMNRNYVDLSIFQEKTIINQQLLRDYAVLYFGSLKVWDNRLQDYTVTYLQFEGQELRKIENPNNAQLVRIDFFIPPIYDLPVVTPTRFTSGVHLVFSASDRRITNVLEASFQFHFPDITNPAHISTYPTTTGESAWQHLQSGEAYIASGVSIGDHAVIRDIYLAYYQDTQYQPYLQPVWVLEGDNDFVAMVPAVDPAWTGQ